MEIDPAALSRTATLGESSATPSLASKALPGSSKDAGKSAKPSISIPRVDLEPLYTDIKATIGDAWGTYKEAVSQFVLGYRSKTELNSLLEPIVFSDPYKEHLHNRLLCGLFANIARDIPEANVAVWVSANDKPSNILKAAAGDVVEARLKAEVKRLQPRVRHRIKSIKDVCIHLYSADLQEPKKLLTASLLNNARALTAQHSGLKSLGASAADTSASSSSGLNRDVEVRKRYNQPLISEFHDLPASSALSDRVLPICLEEGLSSGVSNVEDCTQLLSTALSFFVKDIVTSIISHVRCDAPRSGPRLETSSTSVPSQDPAVTFDGGLDRTGLGVTTAKYRRRLAEEENLWKKGEVKRSEAGLLPVEIQSLESGRSKPMAGDMRLMWEVNNSTWKALAPWQGERIVLDSYWDSTARVSVEDGDGRRPDDLTRASASSKMRPPTANGINGVNGDGANGVNGHLDAMDVDEPEWSWKGARPADRVALNALLDDCLNIDQ